MASDRSAAVTMYPRWARWTLTRPAPQGASSTRTPGGTSANARSTIRYELTLDGYDAASKFYIYNSHYKASDTSKDRARRNVEATTNKNDANALGEGTHLIYAGDLNLYGGTEAAFGTLTSAGAGQSIDPLAVLVLCLVPAKLPLGAFTLARGKKPRLRSG